MLPSIAFDDDIAWLNIIVRMKPGMSIALEHHGAPRGAAAGARRLVAEAVSVDVPDATLFAGGGRHRHIDAARAVRAAAGGDSHRRRAGAARRLREHRQPAAGARRRAPPRTERAASRSGRRAGGSRARRWWRAPCWQRSGAGLGPGLRATGRAGCSSRSSRPRRSRSSLDTSARLARPRVHRGGDGRHGDAGGRGPRVSRQRVAPMDALREHGRTGDGALGGRWSERAGRRAGGAVADAGCRRGTVRADVRAARTRPAGSRSRPHHVRHDRRAHGAGGRAEPVLSPAGGRGPGRAGRRGGGRQPQPADRRARSSATSSSPSRVSRRRRTQKWSRSTATSRQEGSRHTELRFSPAATSTIATPTRRRG